MTQNEFEEFLGEGIHSYFRNANAIHIPQNIHKYYNLPKDEYVLMSKASISVMLADKIRSGILIEQLFPSGENYEVPHGVNEAALKAIMNIKKDVE